MNDVLSVLTFVVSGRDLQDTSGVDFKCDCDLRNTARIPMSSNLPNKSFVSEHSPPVKNDSVRNRSKPRDSGMKRVSNTSTPLHDRMDGVGVAGIEHFQLGPGRGIPHPH
jgi:hypothetical protein